VLGAPDRYEITNLARYLGFRGVKRIRAVIAPDCGENAGGGISRLDGEFGVDCLLVPDDDFVMAALREAAPESQALPCQYAQLDALGTTFAVDEGGTVLLPGRLKPMLTTLGTQLFGEYRARLT
jgi:hypothetical protein